MSEEECSIDNVTPIIEEIGILPLVTLGLEDFISSFRTATTNVHQVGRLVAEA